MFHAMVFVILQKAVYGHNVSEQVLALTIYLLEMAVMTAEVPNKSVRKRDDLYKKITLV